MAREIKKGDKVTVHFTDGTELNAVTVINTPIDTGDLWYFKDAGGTVYAQNPLSSLFDCIVKTPVANEKAA